MTTTLKTTKEQRDGLLADMSDPDFDGTLLPSEEAIIKDLCHDADRARELEKRLEIVDGIPYDGIESRDITIRLMDKEVAYLRAKLDEAETEIRYARNALNSSGVDNSGPLAERIAEMGIDRIELRAMLFRIWQVGLDEYWVTLPEGAAMFETIRELKEQEK